ncbi:MAG: glycosyltransferase family 4 protein [Planctomycetes bacterium]|nr:glycosyltransferase family 4 protein [Planctomycetota bacterium]
MHEPELKGLAFLACGFDFSGGMEGQARRLAERIAEFGVPVTYVTTSPSTKRRPLRERVGELEVVRVPVLAAVDWATSLGILEVTALNAIARRRTKLDGIYSVHYETGAIASRIGESLGLPVVVKLACGGRFGDAQGVLHSLDRARQQAGLQAATRIAAISGEIEREALELLEIAPENVVRVKNGIDLRRFPLRPDPGRPRVLFLGRLGAQKRIDLLLAAAATLRQRVPDLEVVLAGDGPLLGSLRVEVQRRGLGDVVRFVGRQPDVIGLLAEAAVLVLPSDAEGTSNALLEAMASGVPVVATRVGGTSELVTHDVQGLLVAPGDAAALAAALERLLGDPALRARLGSAGRAHIEAHYDLDQVARQHVELFTELKAQHRPDESRLLVLPGSRAEVLRATTKASLRTGRDGVVSTAKLVADQVRRWSQPGGARAGGVAILVRDVDALGGMERQAMALARGLVAIGMPVTLITCTAPGLARLPERSWYEEREGVRLYRVPLVLYESAAAGILYRNRDRWNVIYAVQLMMGAIGARLGQVLDAPVVVKLACGGTWGDMSALQGLAIRDREQVLRGLSAAQLVCISDEIAAEARQMGFRAEHMSRIPNGVDVDAVAAAAPVQPLGDAPTILFAGRLDRQKGVDLLLHAFATFAEELPLARLLLAGSGPQAKELRELAAQLGVAERVAFLGRRDDVWGLLRGCTVCALPSRSEGISNTLLEALAAGAPVVASDISPNREVIGEGCGVLVPSDDVGAFAHALRTLLNRPADRSRLALLGRARVREAFDMPRVVEAHAELFAQLGAGRARPGALGFTRRFVASRGGDVWRLSRRLLP